MDIQQVTTWILVAVAAIYLGRLGLGTWTALWSGRGGCGSGCAKCVSAELAGHRHAASPKNIAAAKNVIPLSAIQRAPVKRDG
jgi:hypothetical protein